MLIQFLLSTASVVVGIILYKKIENIYEDLRWKFTQRHSSTTDPWDSW